MKMLYVASPSSFTSQLHDAFLKKGVEVVSVNERANFILPKIFHNNLLIRRILRKSRRLKQLNKRKLNDIVLTAAKRFKPDILFVNKGALAEPETLAKIKTLGIKTVNWFPENIFNSPYYKWFIRHHKAYDYFFTFDPLAIEKFGSDNLRYLPFAVNPESYKYSKITEREMKKYLCNICFVGAHSYEREQVLNSIKDFGLKVFGWKGWGKSSLAQFYGGPLNSEETAKLYNFAKICLNMNISPKIKGVNLRTFEIPAAGGFQLSDFREDVKNLFEVGREIEIFENTSDLRRKTEFYLKNDNLRKQIAQKGHQKVLQEHTLEKRVTSILKFIKGGHQN